MNINPETWNTLTMDEKRRYAESVNAPSIVQSTTVKHKRSILAYAPPLCIALIYIANNLPAVIE